MSPPAQPPSTEFDAEFASALDELLRAWGEDRNPSEEEFFTSHPRLAGCIGELFDLAREIALVRPAVRPRVPGYELLGEAGRGGMGTVYRARQLGLDRLVALKVQDGGWREDIVRPRFLAEARSLGKLRHPSIVTIYEVIDLPDVCAYAMEWIGGGSLADLLERRRNSKLGLQDPLRFQGASGELVACETVPWCCRLGVALGRALSQLHARGLLHRDVKPGNVLLREDGTPLLSDFGLVHDAELGLTRTGQFLGTPCFAPPEQLRGDASELGPTADVFSLGATLHCALSGSPPYPGRTPAEILASIAARRRPSLMGLGLPADLETIVGKCLEADARDRYQSAAEVADDLQRMLDLRPIRARPLGLVWRLVRLLQRNRQLLAAAVAAALLALCASGSLGWWLYERWTLPGRVEAALRAARIHLLDPAYTSRVMLSDRALGDPSAVYEAQLPSPLVDAPEAAAKSYAQVLALSPADPEILAEVEVVVVARALLRNEILPAMEDLRAYAPATRAAALQWRANPGANPTVPDAPIDRRALGLLAFLTHRPGICHAAWAGLELAGDPFIDAASAQAWVSRGDYAKASPRFARAAEAWPEAGFLAIGMARCALAAGDTDVAARELARAEQLEYHDPFSWLRIVRADLHAARKECSAARSMSA